MPQAPLIAVLPFACPTAKDDPAAAEFCRGIATLIEGRLRLIPRARAYVQHLVHAPEGPLDQRAILQRTDMWPLEEALALPSPEAIKPTHLVQGCIVFGETMTATLEVIDTTAAYIPYREWFTCTPDEFPSRFFAQLGIMALSIQGDLAVDVRHVIQRRSTASFDAFRAYLAGLSRRIDRRIQSRLAEPPEQPAFEPFVAALEADPGFLEPCIAIDVLAQECFRELNSVDAAADVLRRAARSAPHYVGFLRTLGVHLFDSGRLADARKPLEEFLERTQGRDPSAPAAYVRLAAIYHQAEGLDRARALLTTARNRFPHNIDILESLALCLAAAGANIEAERLFREVLDDDPRRPMSLMHLAMLRWKDNDAPRARSLFDLALDSPGAPPVVWRRYLEFLEQLDDTDRADEVATDLVERFPEDWHHWVHVATTRRRRGELDAARHCLARARSLVPPNADSDAIDLAEFSLDSPADFARFAVSAEAIRVSEIPAAGSLEILRTIADANPQRVAIWRTYAEALSRTEDFPRTVEAWRHVASMIPARADVQAALARALWKNGDQLDALVAIGIAIELDATAAPLRLERARYLLELGRLAEARAELQLAEPDAPDPERLRHLRERLEETMRSPASTPEQQPGLMRRMLGWLHRAPREGAE